MNVIQMQNLERKQQLSTLQFENLTITFVLMVYAETERKKESFDHEVRKSPVETAEKQ